MMKRKKKNNNNKNNNSTMFISGKVITFDLKTKQKKPQKNPDIFL